MTGRLALDLGTSTGYAAGFSVNATVSGVANFKPGRYDGGGMRFLRFRKWLDDMHAALEFDRVFFEEVRRHRGVDAAHVYGGLLGHLTAWCEDHGVAYQGVPVGTIKKFATDKGNANKQAMIDAARDWGFEPQNDDEADAIAILRWSWSEFS